MPFQSWEELFAVATADGTAVANTTTETSVFSDYTFPANFFQYGRKVKVSAYGKLSTTGTPTITFAFRWGGAAGTLLATTEAITNGSGVANVMWHVEADITCRSNGATGALLVVGKCFVHTAAGTVVANVFSVSGYDAPAAVTVDLTADIALAFTADWSAASASNTLTGMDYSIHSLN